MNTTETQYMKRILLSSTCIVSIFFAGCASAPPQSAPVTQVTQAAPAMKPMPAWIDKPEYPGALAAVGSAQPNPLGDRAFQRQTAAAAARVDMAERLNTRVQNMFRNLQQQSTMGSTNGKQVVRSDAMNRVIESVTRTLTNQQLAGSAVQETWTDPDGGTLYVLLTLSKESTDHALEQIARQQIQSAIKSGVQGLDDATAKLDAAIADSQSQQ
jgi:hypothetical protein